MTEDKGEISDGYHTFNELYEHRNLLFINMCLIKSSLASWRPHFEGWDALYLKTPAGQISYHVPIRHRPLYEQLKGATESDYDGHTSGDVVDRLRKLASESRLFHDLLSLPVDAIRSLLTEFNSAEDKAVGAHTTGEL